METAAFTAFYQKAFLFLLTVCSFAGFQLRIKLQLKLFNKLIRVCLCGHFTALHTTSPNFLKAFCQKVRRQTSPYMQKQLTEKLLIWENNSSNALKTFLWSFFCVVIVLLIIIYIVQWVKWNHMPVPCSEEGELKIHEVKASSCMFWMRVCVRSIVLYENLRHSMTSHSGCWWFKSFHLQVN